MMPALIPFAGPLFALVAVLTLGWLLRDRGPEPRDERWEHRMDAASWPEPRRFQDLDGWDYTEGWPP